MLDHLTFIGLDLHEIIAGECVAREVDFRQADLTRADLSHTDLAGSLFSKTNLAGADLTHAKNYSINASQNTLRGARFSMPEAMSLLHGLDIILVE